MPMFGYGAIVTAVICCNFLARWSRELRVVTVWRRVGFCSTVVVHGFKRILWVGLSPTVHLFGVCCVQLSSRFVGAHRWNWWVLSGMFLTGVMDWFWCRRSVLAGICSFSRCWSSAGLQRLSMLQWFGSGEVPRASSAVGFVSWVGVQYRVGMCTTGFDLLFWKAVGWNFPPSVY